MTPLIPVETSSILARSRPRAILALWTWEATLGIVLGSSAASVASEAYGRHPDGDAPLFLPGALPLLDLVRHSLAAYGPLLSLVVVIAAVAHLVGIVPSAAALSELAFSSPAGGAPRVRDTLARAMAAVPASFTVCVLTLLAQAGLLLAGVLVASVQAPLSAAHLGDPGGDRVTLAILGLTVVAATLVGVVGDLSRAAVVRHDATSIAAVRAALRVFAARPVALAWAYGWRAASSWLPVATGAVLAARLGGRGGLTLVVLAAFHQIVIVVRVAIRTSWMARSLRAVDD
jgi:hypothetical protein